MSEVVIETDPCKRVKQMAIGAMMMRGASEKLLARALKREPAWLAEFLHGDSDPDIRDVADVFSMLGLEIHADIRSRKESRTSTETSDG